MKKLVILGLVAALGVVAFVFRNYVQAAWVKMKGAKTVAQRLEQYGPAARERWRPHFERAGVPYPPAELALVGLKEEASLEVYARGTEGAWKMIRHYVILAASGGPGPKLREGDNQVPEGIYRIESLNPNSRFHLSLRLNYPNEFDRQQAAKEGRSNLGGDIMIHGNAVSIGCLAMGDEAAEDLFVLAADTGLEKIGVILSPHDFRRKPDLPKATKLPEWTKPLYHLIEKRLSEFPKAIANE